MCWTTSRRSQFDHRICPHKPPVQNNVRADYHSCVPKLPLLIDVAELRSVVMSATRRFYDQRSVPEVRVPQVVNVTGSCENVSTLMRLAGPQGRGANYLSQTGQLALEFFLAELSDCWCDTGSFRFESNDTRHLGEFELVEEEFSWPLGMPSSGAPTSDVLFDALLNRITDLVQAQLLAVLEFAPHLDGYAFDHVLSATEGPYKRVRYVDAIKVLNAEASGDRTFGDDLSPSDEQRLISLLSDGAVVPIFVTHFPASIKFFNMKVCSESFPSEVLSADLLLPGSGECVGAAVRENDYSILERRLLHSSMFRILRSQGSATIDTFRPYLDLIRLRATPLHAGFGLGIERLLQFVLDQDDIRNVSLAYRLRQLSEGT